MQLHVLACRKCHAEIPLRDKAVARGQYSRGVLLDLACGACGQRALYDLAQGPVG